MKKIKFSSASILISSLILSLSSVTNAEDKKDFIVNFNTEVDYSLLNSLNVEILHDYKNIESVLVKAPSDVIPLLEDSIKVHSIEYNNEVSVNGSVIEPISNSEEDINFYNSNTSYGQAYVKSNDAWSKGNFGQGVKIAVVDSGFDVKSSTEVAVKKSISFVTEKNGDSSIQDYHGHGTAMSSLIAGTHSNDFVNGVAPNAEIYISKVLGENGTGDYANIIKGIDWAISQNVDIINLSLGGDVDDFALKSIVDLAYKKGIIVVAGAGNSGKLDPNINTMLYPSKYDSVIAIGATDRNNARTEILPNNYSASGKELDFMAPGILNVAQGLNGDYVFFSGSSNSSAIVSGVIALYLNSSDKIDSSNIRSVLLNSAIDLGSPGKDIVFGNGLVQFTNTPNLSAPSQQQTPSETPNPNNEGFSDVPSSHWAYNSILNLKINKVMVGKDSPDTFKPEDLFTRAEAAVVLNRLTTELSYSNSINFKDLSPSHWAYNDIKNAVGGKKFSGYEDNTFRPSNPITRAEIASVLDRTFRPKPSITNDLSKFSDLSRNHWAFNSLVNVVNSGILSGYPDNTLKPDGHLTRAEMASIVDRLSENLKNN